MKKVFLILAILMEAITLFGQEDEMKTLLGDKTFKIGGFAGPFMSFTMIDGDFAHMMGGGGCILLGDFFIGGYGIGLTNHIPYAGNTDTKLNFGHGGFWMGYHFMSKKLIHPVIGIKTGWGDIKEKYDNIEETGNGDKIFVLTPSVEIELNVTRFFRLAAGGSYQAVFFVNDYNYSNKDFSSPCVFLSFKFGAF